MAYKEIRFGNVLDQQRGIIVHGCNARGVMGSGVAALVKARYPGAFEVYANACKANISDPTKLLGEVIWYQASPDLWIANAITQNNFGRDPKIRYIRYDALQQAFKKVVEFSFSQNDLPVHYPMIGAGLGNGDWSIIHELINNEFVVHPLIKHYLWLLEP